MKHTAHRILAAGIIIFFLCAAGPAHAGWTLEENVPTVNKLRGLNGYAAGQILAVGDYGTLLSYDGTSWTAQETVTDKTIYAVCWVSPTEAFAAADKGRVLYYNGGRWLMDSVTDKRLRCVWGSSAMDVFVAGEDGTMLHFDGSTWETMDVPTSDTLQDIWGSSGTDVYAVGGPSKTGGVGGTGVLIHYDGSRWTAVTEGVYPRFKAIHGIDAGNIFIAGDESTVLNYNAVDETISELTPVTVEDLRNIWAYSESDVFIAGDYGVINHYDGTSWSSMSSGTSDDIFGIWGSSPDNVFAVGKNGIVLKYQSSGNDGETGGDNQTAPCPFVLSIDSREDLMLLRQMRDRHLADSAPSIISLFYTAAADIAAIVRENPALAEEISRLVADNRHNIQNLITYGSAAISKKAQADAADLLDAVGDQAGPCLKTVLSITARSVRSGRLLSLAGISVCSK